MLTCLILLILFGLVVEITEIPKLFSLFIYGKGEKNFSNISTYHLDQTKVNRYNFF